MPIEGRQKKVQVGDGKRRRLYRVQAEIALGRLLKPTEQVHHHNQTQLVICQSHAYHGMLHARTRVLRAGGDPDSEIQCCRCAIVKPFDSFGPSKQAWHGHNVICKACDSARNSKGTGIKYKH